MEASILGISLALPERVRELEQALEGSGSSNGVRLVVGSSAASKELADRVGGRSIGGDLTAAVRSHRHPAA